MNTYEVFFEIYGKKMKAKVSAKDEYDAKTQILNKVIFHKVVFIKEEQPDPFKNIMDIFGTL